MFCDVFNMRGARVKRLITYLTEVKDPAWGTASTSAGRRAGLRISGRRQDGLDHVALVARPGHLVLVAQLAPPCEPPMEAPRRHRSHPRGRHPDVARALGPVVRVERLKRFVDRVREPLEARRTGAKLDRPLVTGRLHGPPRVDGRHGELDQFRAGARARLRRGLLHLLDDDVLAERVDELARPPGDHQLGRVE